MKMILFGAICLLTGVRTSAGPKDINEYMRVNLYSAATASPVLLDGNMTQYSDGFSNTVDFNDAWKLTNFGENFGIIRNGATLVIERRKRFQFSDTTSFRMWNMARRNYTIEVITLNCNHPNVTAFLEDKYLNTLTPVDCNGTTRINFTVDSDPGSIQENRFRIFFKFNPFNNLPFSFGEVRAIRNNAQTQLQWKVNNENVQVRYEVEKSTDGIQFTPISEAMPQNLGENAVYEIDDDHIAGDVFYRVRTIDINNNEAYSQVARLFEVRDEDVFTVYPNPVINKMARFFINVNTGGKYAFMLFDSHGGVVYKTSMNVEPGQANYSMTFPANIPSGIYLLQLMGPNNTKITKMISIQ